MDDGVGPAVDFSYTNANRDLVMKEECRMNIKNTSGHDGYGICTDMAIYNL